MGLDTERCEPKPYGELTFATITIRGFEFSLLKRLSVIQIAALFGLLDKAGATKSELRDVAASATIIIPCAPENADKLAQLALDEIRRIGKEGLTKEEIEKEVESQRRALEKEMKENDRWLGKLEMIYRDEEPLTRLAEPDKLIALVTAPELQAMAVKYLDPDKFVRATLYPDGFVPTETKK